MKKRRQAKILELISSFEIETQEDLINKLLEYGFQVTQATVSRDIRELRLVKERSSGGRYIYSVGKKHSDGFTNHRASGIFSESVINVDYAMNTAVIKCFSGMANAACAAIDSLEWAEVLGTIAGDDTIFILCKSEEQAKSFTSKLRLMLNA